MAKRGNDTLLTEGITTMNDSTQKIQETLARIATHLAKFPNQNKIIPQLSEYTEILKSLKKAIDRTEFTAAFIGTVGVGKTSAIGTLLNLQYQESKNNKVADILQTGSGGVTVCEVIFQYSDRYSICIEPLQESEIKQIVDDFSDFIWKEKNKEVSEGKKGVNLLSQEMERCIRNMLGLPKLREKLPQGKSQTIDKAIELAETCKSLEDLKTLMFECLSLEERTITEIWPSLDENREWQKWLKINIADINYGKNKKISLPKKIIVCGNFPLKFKDINWQIVDTRGIHESVYRTDLYEIIDKDGIFPIIISSFKDAPSTDAYSVLKMGCNLGIGYLEKLEREAVFLIIDMNESHKMVDVDPDLSDEDKIIQGRQIREDHVRKRLENELKWNGYIDFFDCKQEDAQILWQILFSRYETYLDYNNQEISKICDAVDELLIAQERMYNDFIQALQAQYQQWREEADQNTPQWEHLGAKLYKKLKEFPPSTLAASIRRKGEYENCHFYDIILSIARQAGKDFVEKKAKKLKESLKKIISNNEFSDFKDQINVEEKIIDDEMQKFVKDVGNLAFDIWNDCLRKEKSIWDDWADEWGQGRGYQERVLAKINHWLGSQLSIEMHNHFLQKVTARWGCVLSNRIH